MNRKCEKNTEIALKHFKARRFGKALEFAGKALGHEQFHGAYHLAAASARELGMKALEFEMAKNAAISHPSPEYMKAFAISMLDHELWADAMHIFMGIVMDNGDLESQVNASWCAYRLGRVEEAIGYLLIIKKHNLVDMQAHEKLGTIYFQQGRFAEAEEIYREVISLDESRAPSSWYLLSGCKKFTDPSDPDIATMEELLTRCENDKGMANLNFALGKVYGDLGDVKSSWPKYLAGSKYVAGKAPYHHEKVVLKVDELIKVFDGKSYGAGFQSNKPIFVIGMPRSGTTLVEQILNAHPEIFGAGELNYLEDVAVAGCDYPSCVNLAGMALAGEDYCRKIDKLTELPFVVDKMPNNFIHVGLIHAAMPNAKIIHCRRDPIATCWSNFITNFVSDRLSYSNDLENLGKYYREYERLMAHYDTFVPMFDINYEELVSDPEPVIRRLLEYVGVEFHEDCLQHHKQVKGIRTASASQVRQPIYTGSNEKWKAYEEYLGPLKAGVDTSRDRRN